MTDPNPYIRQNTCPHCGHYDWAHPVNNVCTLSPDAAQAAYKAQVIVNQGVKA